MFNRKHLLTVVAIAVAATALTTTGAAGARLITGRDIKDGTVTTKDLSAGVQRDLPLGRLAAHRHKLVTIPTIGGGPRTDGALVATLDLAPGTYYVSVSAGFGQSDGSSTATPILEVMFDARDLGGAQTFRAIAAPFPSSGDASAAATRIVTASRAGSANVYAWGYNQHGGAAGSGAFTADVDVSAIRVQ